MEDAAHEFRKLCEKLKPIKRWNSFYAMSPTTESGFITYYLRIAFQLDMISLTQLAQFVQRNVTLVSRLYALVGEIDACIAIASVRASLTKYAVPEFVNNPQIVIDGLAHPLIGNPVRNNIEWDKNIIITGSNASGKSTFVKAIALNAIFAQSICTCWADRFSMPRAQIISSMALRDNVRGGDSYFIVEVKSLKRILNALREDRLTLCFIDEILRGTNTVERVASSISLLRYLNDQNVLCIAATHDIELTQILTMYKQHHFREEITPQGMTFSYRLLDGPCDTRNAIRLLEQMEFPPQVGVFADEMAKHFDATGKWQ
jgi:DNA mismatch repair ATPase MutS